MWHGTAVNGVIWLRMLMCRTLGPDRPADIGSRTLYSIRYGMPNCVRKMAALELERSIYIL